MEMERCSIVENGGIRIPVGYRFLPTNEELLVHYLRPKVLAVPFPASVIPEFDVFQTDPWGLPGDLSKDRYFFSHHSKTDGKCRRPAGSGHWKSTGKCKLIVVPQSNHQTVGIRTTLVFTQNKSPRDARWFMHQFCFVGRPTTQALDWAVYRLFQKKRKLTKQHSVVSKVKSIEEQPSLIDEIEPPHLSCCSSGVTDEEDPVNESALLLDQEASSDVFPSFSCMRKQDY